jgi:hypothetical protein
LEEDGEVDGGEDAAESSPVCSRKQLQDANNEERNNAKNEEVE